ncbi:hypothetical protein PAXINDRAFT_14518 [Paxillus involutus ATCC 200175]|uniref:Uncharacterized protein n=1 Tax=Paxillus involutus ATCC 200175 TaxID=664439 RepID=A0A0C9SUA4_PAXIN|nr:hypothetical protein PAXINDRAFT_14518 [Paxillus involutus ATCC 200175]
MECKPIQVMLVVPRGITTNISKNQADNLELSPVIIYKHHEPKVIQRMNVGEGPMRMNTDEFVQSGGRILLACNHRKEAPSEEKLTRSGVKFRQTYRGRLDFSIVFLGTAPGDLAPITSIAIVSSTPSQMVVRSPGQSFAIRYGLGAR